jgi:hypothetical protein
MNGQQTSWQKKLLKCLYFKGFNLLEVGQTKYICNTEKIIIAKIYIHKITDSWVYVKTFISDTIMNATIIKIPNIKAEETIFDTIEAAMIEMGIFFYRNYKMHGFDKDTIEEVVNKFRIELDTHIMLEWINLAKNKYPEKFI